MCSEDRIRDARAQPETTATQEIANVRITGTTRAQSTCPPECARACEHCDRAPVELASAHSGSGGDRPAPTSAASHTMRSIRREGCPPTPGTRRRRRRPNTLTVAHAPRSPTPPRATELAIGGGAWCPSTGYQLQPQRWPSRLSRTSCCSRVVNQRKSANPDPIVGDDDHGSLVEIGRQLV